MNTATEVKMGPRYQRRSGDERVAALERRIAELKAKQSARVKKGDPVVREIPKIVRQLRKFAQVAMNHQRPDIANSVLAFNASLDRILRSELGAESDSDSAAD